MTAQANFRYDAKSTPNPNHTTPPEGLESLPPADPVGRVKKRLAPSRRAPSPSIPVEKDGLPSLAAVQEAQRSRTPSKLPARGKDAAGTPLAGRRSASQKPSLPSRHPSPLPETTQEEGYAIPPAMDQGMVEDYEREADRIAAETDSFSETEAAEPSTSRPRRTSTTGSADPRRVDPLQSNPGFLPSPSADTLSARDRMELARFLRPVMEKLVTVRSIQWARMAWKGGGFINPESMPRAIQAHFLALFDQFIRDEAFVFQTLSRLQSLRGGFSLSRGTQLVAIAASFGAWFSIPHDLRG